MVSICFRKAWKMCCELPIMSLLFRSLLYPISYWKQTPSPLRWHCGSRPSWSTLLIYHGFYFSWSEIVNMLSVTVEWWVVKGKTVKGKENRGDSDKILYCNTLKGSVLSLAVQDVTARGLSNYPLWLFFNVCRGFMVIHFICVHFPAWGAGFMALEMSSGDWLMSKTYGHGLSFKNFSWFFKKFAFISLNIMLVLLFMVFFFF